MNDTVEHKEQEKARQQHARVRASDRLAANCANAWTFGKQGFVQYARHLVQIVMLLVLHGRFLGLKETGIIVPFLQSAQAPWSTALGAFEALEYSISQGIFPLLILGIIFFTGISVGRLLCGWACPFGLVQDILSYFPFKKRRDVAGQSEYKDVKYFVVVVSITLAALFGYRRYQAIMDNIELEGDTTFSTLFTVLSPDGTLFAYLPWMGLWKADVLHAAGAVGWLKLGLLVVIIAACLYTPRFFCRYVCPMGMSLGVLSKYKIFKIKTSSKLHKETFNKTLASVCPMGVQQETRSFIDSDLCISCGKCMSAFPKELHNELF